ncbi:LytTR family DNA-binding domain-containing protein [Sediminicola luteus]|uniref:HTH LytTR-type domain-containing protein n=1 Tax=Sediminicola luteus TaxID=319238 RepID=A0A2A4G8B9_9FLAO|nr:LytTR family DNA-binding domain-containing protein [Sediminicola luteus]PCE64228.1 hypothetical protein B7P33_07960 [Sediminicola luteus]
MTLKEFGNLKANFLQTPKQKWYYVLSVGVFSVFFIFVYEPFGVSLDYLEFNAGPWQIFLFLASQALNLSVAIAFTRFIIEPFLPWNIDTIKKQVHFFLFEILVIILTSPIFIILFYWINGLSQENVVLDQPLWLEIVMRYFLYFFVLMYPFLANALLGHIKGLHSEIEVLEKHIFTVAAQYAANPMQPIQIRNEKHTETLQILPKNLLYIKSDNQYIEIYYLEEGQLRTALIRNRLKIVLEALRDYPIKQCHRSYAVNLLNVHQLKKSEGKTYIYINTQPVQQIPVSKSFTDQIQGTFSEYRK